MEIVQVNSIKAWLLAARPKTLAGGPHPGFPGCITLKHWQEPPLRFYWDVPWPMQTAASK